ncbi:IDEAL domain-containing protein [Priestia aryabhattai]|uniref:IDEAL domain-containing protein n=1 Tax=Priestia TaxID=2800373 RepID=UPI000532C46D|nr:MULTISPECIES: IDEAL domain-containing protein [Priestia]KML27535.1 phosphoesterase [Priestia aryabhattai]KMN91404.1 phosphoesterase [Priestia aryabhattai]MED3919148.1 IDEAL domain-containing protein [Priestia aryabhattai]
MENYTSRKMTREEVKVSDATVAQLVLNKSLRDFKKAQLLLQIDQSLEKRDKETFLRLTEELKEVC